MGDTTVRKGSVVPIVTTTNQPEESTSWICKLLLHVVPLLTEPPSLSVHPSSLPLVVSGQSVRVQCDAAGFAPHSLELSWELRSSDGTSRSLGSGDVTGHRQSWDGTFMQSSLLELDTLKLDLGRGGEVTCVGVHPGGTRRASVTLNVIGNGREI